MCIHAPDTCAELFDCCDCGGEDCGCAGCSSCNTCDECNAA